MCIRSRFQERLPTVRQWDVWLVCDKLDGR